MVTLFDARLRHSPTGIGYYVLHLSEQFAAMTDIQVRPICHGRHRRLHRRFGTDPWTPPRGRRPIEEVLPPADVIHGPNFHALAHPKARRVATIHDLGYLKLPECHPRGMPERLDALVRAAIPETAVFVCVSEATRSDFVDAYDVSPDRCVVAYHGVSEKFLDAPRGLAAPRGVAAPYLLHVGAMVPRKDLPTLLESFRLVADEHPELSLVLAGNKTKRWASDWPKVEQWRKEHPNLRHRLKILNYVDDAQMVGLYHGAAAVVTTTLLEGFGLTVLEGLASGVPVVASRTSAIPELVGDIVFYGEPRRPQTYADALRRALAEHDHERRERGRQLARRFTWQKTGVATAEAYRRACLV